MLKLPQYIFRAIAGIMIISGFAACREEFILPETAANGNYLVVEGFLNTGADTNFIQLTRARNLEAVNLPDPPETGATLTILNASGQVICRSEHVGAGRYRILGARLQNNQPYQLRIVTSQGGQYQSDFFEGKPVPPIGNINYQFDKATNLLNITVNTSDPTNTTQYYRWNYEETWEYRADFESILDYDGVALFPRLPVNQIYRCWAHHNSTEIILGSSAKLQNDIIENEHLLSIPKGGNRFNVRYSLLTRQYPLQKDAFDYWQNMQKLTEQAGSIFDAQPTELFGNIKNLNNNQEPVIGFISAGSITEKRIFITRFEAPDMVMPSSLSCQTEEISMNADTLNKYLGSQGKVPLFAAAGAPDAISIGERPCTDCRVLGGTTTAPAYW